MRAPGKKRLVRLSSQRPLEGVGDRVRPGSKHLYVDRFVRRRDAHGTEMRPGPGVSVPIGVEAIPQVFREVQRFEKTDEARRLVLSGPGPGPTQSRDDPALEEPAPDLVESIGERDLQVVAGEQPRRVQAGVEKGTAGEHTGLPERPSPADAERSLLPFGVRREGAEWRGIDPHDMLEVPGTLARLDGDLFHYSYRDLEHHLHKVIYYARVTADSYAREGRTFHWYNLIFSP